MRAASGWGTGLELLGLGVLQGLRKSSQLELGGLWWWQRGKPSSHTVAGHWEWKLGVDACLARSVSAFGWVPGWGFAVEGVSVPVDVRPWVSVRAHRHIEGM